MNNQETSTTVSKESNPETQVDDTPLHIPTSAITVFLIVFFIGMKFFLFSKDETKDEI